MTRCIVVDCTSGYESNCEKVHFFRVPKDENLKNMWQAALRRRDFIIKSSQAVCEKHFLSSDIVWHREIYDKKGNVLGVSAPFKVPRLRKGTIPSQFPWTEGTEGAVQVVQDDTKENSQNKNTNCEEMEEILDFEMSRNKENSSHSSISFGDLINILNRKQLHMPKQWTYTQCFDYDTRLLVFFLPICQKLENNKDGYRFNCLKEVLLQENMTVQINILKQPILNMPSDILNKSDISITETIESTEQLQKLLFFINDLSICPGVNNITNKINELGYNEAFKDVCGIWRHRKCLLLVPFMPQKCKFCSTIRNSLNQKRRRTKVIKSIKRIKLTLSNVMKQKKLMLLRQKYYKTEKAKKRAEYIANKVKRELINCIAKIKEVSTTNIKDLLKEKQLPQNQLIAIQEMIEAAKHKNPKGLRYNEEWILLCMLIHMKSPITYNFLRDNKILTIPCVRTIRRYLSIIDTPCGFDLKFFEMFKLALQKKGEKEKHGILMLDEIHLRECISINSKNLTYNGLINFGNDGTQSLTLDDKANHGLVIMFQPLADFYSQPIGVFASRGPVSGEVLAQLIIKAIALLEGINVKVHGIITDGAATNRKFWSTVGVCGSKDNLVNYFEHPTVHGRYLYVFSDTPHLIKTIRNRLYSTPLQV